MSSVKQRRTAIERVAQDIKDYSLDKGIGYPAYLQIVAQPLLPSALRKSFKSWRRMISAVEKAHPDVWDHSVQAAPEPVVTPEPAPEPVIAEDPLEALKKSSSTGTEVEESNE